MMTTLIILGLFFSGAFGALVAPPIIFVCEGLSKAQTTYVNKPNSPYKKFFDKTYRLAKPMTILQLPMANYYKIASVINEKDRDDVIGVLPEGTEFKITKIVKKVSANDGRVFTKIKFNNKPIEVFLLNVQSIDQDTTIENSCFELVNFNDQYPNSTVYQKTKDKTSNI